MINARNAPGELPPPYWPDRLTGEGDFKGEVVNQATNETDQIIQEYIFTGSIGPCLMVYVDDLFHSWWPCLTYERCL